ncbi:MAG: DUF2914 domain-containing protein [Candidatus Paceibacterota bacterium]
MSLLNDHLSFKRLNYFFKRYERFLIPGSLLFGITTDVLLFRSINFQTAFTVLFIHFLFAGLIIFFTRIYDNGYFRRKGFRVIRILSPLLLQYTFGALLSACLIFYWFSSSFFASWPFILLIIVLVLSNDLLKRYYLQLKVQIGVYFFITFSLSVLILPFLVDSLGVHIFLLAGLFSLFIIFLYLKGLSYFLPEISYEKRNFTYIIGAIFVVINIFYFLNIIPPVPLSLREGEVLHFVEKEADGYRVMVEERSFPEVLLPGEKVQVTGGGRLYFFSAIFAPGQLETDIVHNWQYYDKGKWVDKSRIEFPITGGRNEGYRGYSYSDGISSGKWRVSVETARGQVIGRETFRVISSENPPELKEEKR